MDVTLVTTNAGKVREVRALLAPWGLRVTWTRRSLLEPQADSLHEVARAKLRQVTGVPGCVMVEDSGLFIDALGGFPGVYSAPIYRMWKFGPILELLRERPRRASFRTVVGLRRGRRTWTFEGVCRGEIVPTPREEGGFGFDPIFRPVGANVTFAEMSIAEKGRSSHRAKAFREVARFLTRQRRASEADRATPSRRRAKV
ncbi:MAG: non-canonical purine NTP pyrophosphatase [Thermoplasmata archaeon]